MSIWSRVSGVFKRRGESPAHGVAGLFATPIRPAGWWRDDQVEQLRNYQSWVYAAVNAIAQEVAQQRPFLYRNTGQAEPDAELVKARYPAFTGGDRQGIVLQADELPSEPVARRLEEKIQSRRGGRENWHRPLLLEQGLNPSPWTLTPAEMDFLNSAR